MCVVVLVGEVGTEWLGKLVTSKMVVCDPKMLQLSTDTHFRRPKWVSKMVACAMSQQIWAQTGILDGLVSTPVLAWVGG